MSLNNPKSLVTEERLHEFYGSILPYLGGMPEMLANKFSKGDLYSTDEKMIGQWIDGKPLYQKTINFGTLPNKSTTNVPHNISDIDVIVSVTGITYDSGKAFFYPLPYTSPDSVGDNILLIATSTFVRVMTGYNRSNLTNCYIILQYTKTTDSAISIGSDTDYSTEEKIVGTWIDGKPLYQKTIVTTTPEAAQSGTAGKYVDIGADIDFGKIVSSEVLDASSILPMPYFKNDLSAFVKGYLYNHTYVAHPNTIVINCNSWYEKTCYVTIQYTKTTD